MFQPPKDRRIGLRAFLPKPPREVVRLCRKSGRACATFVRPVFEPTALLSAVRKLVLFAPRYKGWLRPPPDSMLPIMYPAISA